MAKKPQAYRRIGEVAEWLGVATSTVRYWTSRFKQVRPVQRAGGRRYYRVEDMVLLGGIKTLLHDHGFSIDELRREMKVNGVGNVAYFSQALPDGIEHPEAIEIRADVMTFTMPEIVAETGDEEQAEEEMGRTARVAGGAEVTVSAGRSTGGTDIPRGDEPVAEEPHADPVEKEIEDALDAVLGEPEPQEAQDDASDHAPEAERPEARDAEPPEAGPPAIADIVADEAAGSVPEAVPATKPAIDLDAPLPAADGSDIARPTKRQRRAKADRADVATLMRELESLRARMGR